MRKCLGVLAGAVALCIMSWAQAPPSAPDQAPAPAQAPAPPATKAPDTTTLPSAPTPQESSSKPTSVPIRRKLSPSYPRIEWFGGYSYGQTGFFNSGHWAELNGWDASLTFNVATWLGLTFDGGEYFGNSKIDTLTYLPFPSCGGQSISFCPTTSPTFNVHTREYNFLFGGQFPYRKYENWTPFGEVMYGHDGVRGTAFGQNNSEAIEVSSGRALLVGGGADHKINERFSFRVKADYFETNTDFASLGKKKQDNFRVSVGVVIKNVRKKKRRLEDETDTEP